MKNRILWIDLLRITAAIAVIVLHISNSRWNAVNPASMTFLGISIVNSAVRWCVPVFVMISGVVMLDLDREITYKKIYFKYIPKLLFLYVVWCFIYAFVRGVVINEYEFSEVLKLFLNGNYHLWYLPMLIGLYMITPLLRKFLSCLTKKEFKYILFLFIVFSVIVPSICELSFVNEYIKIILRKFSIPMISGYVGYYLLGFYFSSNKIDKKYINLIFILGIVSFISMSFLTSYYSVKAGVRVTAFYNNFSLFTCLESLAIFLFFEYKIGEKKVNNNVKNIVFSISECTLGVYLIHDLFIICIENLGFTILDYPIYITIFIFSLICVIISFLIVFIGKRTFLKMIL